ncbi:MAG: EamA family transporter [Gemmatimonadetes bacterium]|nr:EamA family transporter [Gemmatimonadota bacterium]MDA1104067.1 EamA family transporter [Gemmatimonadota bacterium]
MQQTSSQSASGSGSPEPRLFKVVLAFAAVYLIWGSTYLAILWAIETMPPLGMASVRFLIAGSLLFVWALSRGAPRPTGRQWRDAAVAGTLLLAGGNGAVVLAEQWVPSGLTALLVASVPLWLVILDTLFGSKVRPTLRTSAGLVIGFVGVGVLAGSPGVGAGGRQELVGVVVVLFGALAWASGSLYTRHARNPPPPRVLVGMQMLCGGVVLGCMSLAMGEPADFDIAGVSGRSIAALVYLIVAGALIGYVAYIWLLTVTTPARVGTYAYVNPLVAMLLGWGLADEPLTFRSILAAIIILGSVVVITLEPGGPRGVVRPVGLPVEVD